MKKFFTAPGAHVLSTTTQPICVMQNCYTILHRPRICISIPGGNIESRWNQGSDGNKILKHVTPFWCTKREFTSEKGSVVNNINIYKHICKQQYMENSNPQAFYFSSNDFLFKHRLAAPFAVWLVRTWWISIDDCVYLRCQIQFYHSELKIEKKSIFFQTLWIYGITVFIFALRVNSFFLIVTVVLYIVFTPKMDWFVFWYRLYAWTWKYIYNICVFLLACALIA